MENKKRLLQLDSIRGLAACAVAFIWHYQHFAPQNVSPFSQKLGLLYSYGWLGVEVFFILSRFVFCYVYNDKIQNNEISFSRFMKLRFCRLYPLFFITLIVVALGQIYRTSSLGSSFIYVNNDVYHFILNLLFLQSGWFEKGFSFNGPSWSISVEFVCYIIFYILTSKIKNKKIRLTIDVLIALLGVFLIKAQLNYPLFNDKMGRGFLCFFVGTILYEINCLISKSKYKNAVLIGCFAILLTLFALVKLFTVSILGNVQLLLSILIAPTLIIICLNSKIVSKVLNFMPIVYVGEISYSIYLWHFAVQLFINTINIRLNLGLNFSSVKVFLMYILITIIISAISYELIEKRLGSILRKKMILR